MTIEDKPNINFDYRNLYDNQRKDRLSDVIGEYLNDDESSILTFYNDLQDEVQGWIDYHQKYLEKSIGILKLIKGS